MMSEMLQIEKLSKDNYKKVINHPYVHTSFQNIVEFIEDPSCIMFLAFINDKVIGYTYGYIMKRVNSNPMLYIHSLDVYEPYRRQNVGSKLIKSMIDFADSNKFVKTFLFTNRSNNKAFNLYSKLKGVAKNDDDVLFEWNNNILR